MSLDTAIFAERIDILRQNEKNIVEANKETKLLSRQLKHHR